MKTAPQKISAWFHSAWLYFQQLNRTAPQYLKHLAYATMLYLVLITIIVPWLALSLTWYFLKQAGASLRAAHRMNSGSLAAPKIFVKGSATPDSTQRNVFALLNLLHATGSSLKPFELLVMAVLSVFHRVHYLNCKRHHEVQETLKNIRKPS